MYPTYSDSYEKQTFLDAFSSKDLVHWEKISLKIITTDEVKWAQKCMWAPAALYKDGKYYLFFGANDVHEGEIEAVSA